MFYITVLPFEFFYVLFPFKTFSAVYFMCQTKPPACLPVFQCK